MSQEIELFIKDQAQEASLVLHLDSLVVEVEVGLSDACTFSAEVDSYCFCRRKGKPIEISPLLEFV